METGYDVAVVTLVALRDGTVSLYFSNGGGAIGIGGNERPRQICLELLSGAPHFLAAASPAAATPPPAKNETIFYFLTSDGVRTFRAPEVELGENRSPMSPLFHKCHELIAASREFFGPPKT